jgi:type IV secretory pathway VirJ component
MRTRLLLAFLLLSHAAAATAQETWPVDRFFKVMIYRSTPYPAHVVIFVSGDGGWNQGVMDMSQVMAGLDTLVVGIDIRYYLRTLRNGEEECSNMAADLAALGRLVESRLGYPRPVLPWLAGYSSGATMAYAALVQAPPGTFQGAMSFGFCPDLPLVKPTCRGSGLEWERGPRGRGAIFQPSQVLQQPWVVFQGTMDEMCLPAKTQEFAGRTARSEVIELPNVGHGFAVLREWQSHFAEVFRRLTAADTQQ